MDLFSTGERQVAGSHIKVLDIGLHKMQEISPPTKQLKATHPLYGSIGTSWQEIIEFSKP